jgi:Tfp pilus assembly protein PilF
MRQAYTIELRQKLDDARSTASRGDLVAAASLYEDAYTLVQRIGSGIPDETAQTISGLVSIRLELARQAMHAGDLLEANRQVSRALVVDPKNPAALALKQQIVQTTNAMKGQMPDTATLEKVPAIVNDKTQAGTLVQDGKLLYEMGKFEEAEVKLNEALKLDPDNTAAFYYLNLIKQADYIRQEHSRNFQYQDKMVEVQKAWSPRVGIGLPVPNPYVTNTDVHTSPDREVIYRKLSNIRMDSVAWQDGLPLSEAIRFLSEQSKLRDVDKEGINFLFNPNVETGGAEAENATGAGGGGPVAINPQTGLPEANGAAAATPEASVDPSTINVKLDLNNISLQDLLDAIVLVADHPIKYSVEDYAVVFSVKPSGPEPPILESRIFKVDPNTFYQGLQSVSAFVFGSVSSSGTGTGGSSSSSSSGGNGQSVSGAVVPVVDMAPGGSQLRSSSSGSSGGGGAGTTQGSLSPGGGGGVGGEGGGGASGAVLASGGGVEFLSIPGYMQNVSVAAQVFFKTLGVNLTAPGRSIFFNDRLGMLFVKATPSELDTIERAIQALNQVAPEVHIKARFIEVQQNDNTALGFDWYLGNFVNGSVVANGGSAPSLNVPVSSANPLGAFPGNTAASLISGSSSDQAIGNLVTANSGIPTLATVTGIMTDPNFRVVLHALESRTGTEMLAAPEVVTISGRQTEMRATDIQYILTGYGFESGGFSGGVTPTTTGGTP